MSKDVCVLLSYFLKKNIINTNLPDDVLFTVILNKIKNIKNCLNRNEYFINNNVKIKIDKNKKIKTNININDICFRVKSKNRVLDHIKMFKFMKFFYNTIDNKNKTINNKNKTINNKNKTINNKNKPLIIIKLLLIKLLIIKK